LPFNVVTLTFVYVLGLEQFPLVAKGVATTPEQRLDEHVCNHRRYPGSPRTLALPFSGRWTVWQGFDGRWTHQGPWRYAYDFVITGEDGETHTGDGTRLDQYHAFRKPVLSPVRGRVVRVVQDQPDNPIGVTDRARNWGNLVVIADERNFFVEISHLAEGSVRVEEGQWVERGSLLGLCGNSGYSPQPHIHIQVQPTDEVGASTLSFSFVSFVAEGRFHANDLPAVDRVVEPAFPDKALDVRMGLVLDEVFTYEIRQAGSSQGQTALTVRMAPDSTFYLDSGAGRLYFGKHEDTFYFYRLEGDEPALRALFLALPRLPLSYREGMTWKDHVPLSLVTRGVKRAGAHLLRSLHHRFGQVRTDLRFEDERTVRGSVTSRLLGTSLETEVELDPTRGVRRVRVGDYELERLDEEASP
jgi:murein DD-endopeptidase MepM/ murein hydrolase activator NlpD